MLALFTFIGALLLLLAGMTIPFVGIWSQYPKTANYVCIEPWWGIADRDDADGKLEHKYGMNHLEPNKEFQAGFSMTFHSDADPEE